LPIAVEALEPRNLLTVSLPESLLDSLGFEWDVVDDGSISDGSSDAFDGGFDHAAFGSGFATAEEEAGGRELVIGPHLFGDIQLVRKVFVPSDRAFARFLEIVTNTGSSTAKYTVEINTNLGSDSSTEFVDTSTGDLLLDTSDEWIVTDDADGAGDPTIAHVVAAGSGRTTTAGTTAPGDDDVSYTYGLTLAPGETKIVMHFGVQSPNRSTARNTAALLAAGQLDVYEDMSATEIAQVVNFNTSPRPLPLSPQSPLGSLIYDAAVQGSIVVPGLGRDFAVNLDADQTLTVAIDPASGLRPRLEVRDAGGVVGSLEAVTVGQGVVLQNLSVDAAGTYVVSVTGTDNTTGSFALRVVANARAEAEVFDGPANDSFAAAEDLDNSFLSLGVGSRGAVLGTLGGPDFYRFTLNHNEAITLALTGAQTLELFNPAMTLVASGVAADNLTQVISHFPVTSGTWFASVASPVGGEYRLVVTRNAAFDTEGNGPGHAQPLPETGATLGFADGQPASSITQPALNDPVPISLAPTLFDKEDFEWDIVSDGGISDGSSDAFDGGFDHVGFPNFATGFVEEAGREIVVGAATFGNIQVTRKIFVPANHAYARFLEIVTNQGASTANYTVELRTNLGSDSQTELVATSSGDALFDTDDDWLVTDDAPGSSDPVVTHVVSGGLGAPTTASISGDTVSYTYALTLAPGETKIVLHFGAQSSSRDAGIAKAQLLAVLGLDALARMTPTEVSQVVNFAADPTPGDFYTFPVAQGELIALRTATPADGPLDFANTLDPLLELFDPIGTLVESDDNSGADGRNASLTHTATMTGLYTIRIVGQASLGEYILRPGSGCGAPTAAAGDHVFASCGGFVDSPLDAVTFSFTVPTSFTLAGGSTILGFHVNPGPGFNPLAVAVAPNGGGASVTSRLVVDDVAAGGSLRLASVTPGDYLLTVSSQGGSTGAFSLDVFLAGDADGDHDVDAADQNDLRARLGAISSGLNYTVEADVNLDNRITTFDYAQTRLNAGDAVQELGPLGFFPLGFPLLVSPGGTAAAPSDALTSAQLSDAVATAKRLWEGAGLTPAEQIKLHRTQFQITDLAGLQLGTSWFGDIRIDVDAGGYGWQFDTADRRWAGSRVDLLTTVMHELGHALGRPDIYDSSSRDDLMFGYLDLGVRRVRLWANLSEGLPAVDAQPGAWQSSPADNVHSVGIPRVFGDDDFLASLHRDQTTPRPAEGVIPPARLAIDGTRSNTIRSTRHRHRDEWFALMEREAQDGSELLE